MKRWFFFKRAFDIIGSFTGIVLLCIPLSFLIILLKMISPGPIFFKQQRVGRHGVPFTVIKLRTMNLGSDQFGSITSGSDTRITPIGRILRKYKLDEFPQLWNVLIGKMSFVGPRPDVPGYADKLQGDSRKILELRPGITGPASIYFRDEEELLSKVENPKDFNDKVIWPKKIELNLCYLQEWSFWKDIGYIFITIFPVLSLKLKLIPCRDDLKG
jgi:lipopolysaccharide/colanic/teichoic acid biosynthesis glycosyltransferase